MLNQVSLGNGSPVLIAFVNLLSDKISESSNKYFSTILKSHR
jgi:hypothetical protein